METHITNIEDSSNDQQPTQEILPEPLENEVKSITQSNESTNNNDITLSNQSTANTNIANSDQTEKQKTKKEIKKKPEAKNKTTDSRPRAKTTTSVFESNLNKTKETTKVNKIVATGIGENKFNNLLSMFDKSKSDKPADLLQTKEENKSSANKLDMAKLTTFTSIENTEKKKSAEIEIKPTLSIKERMELLKKEGERTSAKGNKILDPVLEMQANEQADEDNEDDLVLSEDENAENVEKDEKQEIYDDLELDD